MVLFCRKSQTKWMWRLICTFAVLICLKQKPPKCFYCCIFPSFKMFCCAHTFYWLMLLFNGCVEYVDGKNQIFSIHFYTNCALKWPLIFTYPVVTLSILLCLHMQLYDNIVWLIRFWQKCSINITYTYFVKHLHFCFIFFTNSEYHLMIMTNDCGISCCYSFICTAYHLYAMVNYSVLSWPYSFFIYKLCVHFLDYGQWLWHFLLFINIGLLCIPYVTHGQWLWLFIFIYILGYYKLWSLIIVSLIYIHLYILYTICYSHWLCDFLFIFICKLNIL